MKRSINFCLMTKKGKEMWNILANSRWAKLKYVLILTILMANVKDIEAGLPPQGSCSIPVDPGCSGCDFENLDSVTTEFWGASVEAFLQIGTDNKINIVTTPTCSTSVDVNHQCSCSGPQISTPVYYCNNHIDRFMDFDFYTDCSSGVNPSSPFLNHFRIVNYDSVYSALGIHSNPCSQFADHFGGHVLKLGDDYQGRKIATLIKKIVVSPELLDFSFDYALILQNPAGHSEIQKPSFRVLIYDDTTNVTHDENGKTRVDLNWGSNEIFASHPKLKSAPSPNGGWRYLDWSCGKIDLSGFNLGDTLSVVFEQRDCGRGGGHWSKVFIDNIGNGMCKKIKQDQLVTFSMDSSYYVCNDSVKLCFNYEVPMLPLLDDTIFGELNIYLQSLEGSNIIRRDTSLGLTSASGGQYCFSVPLGIFQNFTNGSFNFAFSSGIECYNLIPSANTFNINISELRNRDIDFDLGPDVVLCSGQTKVLNATVSGASYLWKGGATTSTITVDTTGIYWVAVTKDSCTKYDTIKVIFIEDPALDSIPYKTRHNCISDESGILQLLWNQKTGGVLTAGANPTAVTYIDDLSYYLYKDNLDNNTYDALCSEPYGSGLLAAGFRDSLFITGLKLGDYKIVLKPNTICRKVIEDGITTDSICIPYSQCYNDSITFTFTIRKHIYPKLLEDKILCPGGMVSLRVPSRYYDNLPPESITWKSVCGIYDPEYSLSARVTSSVVTDTLRDYLINGRGGVHTVEVVTQDGCIIRDTAVVADLKPLIIPDSMPSALATNAVNYNSFWSTQYNNVKWPDAEMVEIFTSANIYSKGEAGIYRPQKNHDYLDSLNTTIGFTNSYSNAYPSTQLNDLNIRSTGNIMPYKLFNYGNPLFVDCIPQWIHNSTMTKYSPSGFDIENKDIMGIHSSALYGYNDMLPIAVASNAKNDEIGYESFEEYSKDTQASNCYDSLTQLNNSTGNIDLVRQTESLLMPKSKDYEIVRAFNRYAMIKGNICNACEDPFLVEVNAQTVPVDIRVADIKQKNFSSYQTRIFASPCSDSNYTILQLDKGSVSQTFDELKCGFWVGNIKVTEKIFVPLIENTGFELDDTKAHTGNYSLKVPKNKQVFLPQTDMTLQPRQTYYIGAWIHNASMDTLSPGALKQRHITDSIGIFVKLPNNEAVFIRPSGEVINGWQKIEGTFTMPAGTRTQIQLGFHAAEEFNIDDIRVYPQNSAIQTYVYDPNNYKVRAVLDQNNYATVYQYDDEGNLFAIKKETVKGIKTIQVSGSHLKSEK